MIDLERKSIPLAQFRRERFPHGGPTLETLRLWIDDGNLQGYTVKRGSRNYYFVYLDAPTPNKLKVNEFLKQLE